MSRPFVFHRLVRFQNARGEVRYGELPQTTAAEDNLIGLEVNVYDGDDPWSLAETSEKDIVKQVRSLLPIPEVQSGRSRGLTPAF